MPELFGLPCVHIISGIAGYIFVIVSPAILPAILPYKPYFLQHPQEVIDGATRCDGGGDGAEEHD